MSRRQTCSLLLIAFGLFYLVPLSNHGPGFPTRPATRRSARRCCWAATGCRHFLGLRYFEKPVAGYWMIALGQAVFGENLFGVRIASFVATALSVLLAYLLARRLWRDPRTSLACALLYASFGLIAGQSGYANLDPQFTFWVNLSLVALWHALDAGSRRALLGWTLLGLACGMGFLTKGFLAWLLPVLVALPYMLWQRAGASCLATARWRCWRRCSSACPGRSPCMRGKRTTGGSSSGTNTSAASPAKTPSTLARGGSTCRCWRSPACPGAACCRARCARPGTSGARRRWSSWRYGCCRWRSSA